MIYDNEFQTAWVQSNSLVNTPSCHVNTSVSMNCFCFKNNKLRRDKNQGTNKTASQEHIPKQTRAQFTRGTTANRKEPAEKERQ